MQEKWEFLISRFSHSHTEKIQNFSIFRWSAWAAVENVINKDEIYLIFIFQPESSHDWMSFFLSFHKKEAGKKQSIHSSKQFFILFCTMLVCRVWHSMNNLMFLMRSRDKGKLRTNGTWRGREMMKTVTERSKEKVKSLSTLPTIWWRKIPQSYIYYENIRDVLTFSV